MRKSVDSLAASDNKPVRSGVGVKPSLRERLRWWLTFGGFIFLGFLVSMSLSGLSDHNEESTWVKDTYGTGPSGLKGLHDMLLELPKDLAVGGERIRVVPQKFVMDNDGTTMVMLEPKANLMRRHDGQFREVTDWVRNGGRLVVSMPDNAMSFDNYEALLEKQVDGAEIPRKEGKTATPIGDAEEQIDTNTSLTATEDDEPVESDPDFDPKGDDEDFDEWWGEHPTEAFLAGLGVEGVSIEAVKRGKDADLEGTMDSNTTVSEADGLSSDGTDGGTEEDPLGFDRLLEVVDENMSYVFDDYIVDYMGRTEEFVERGPTFTGQYASLLGRDFNIAITSDVFYTIQVDDASLVSGTVALKTAWDRNATIAASLQVGKGEIVLLTDDSWLRNDLLRKADNATVAWTVLSAGGQHDVAFDGFFQGRIIRGSYLYLFTHFPFGFLAAMMLFAAIVLGWRGSQRLGPAQPEPEVTRRDVREYLHAVGALFLRGRAFRFLLEEYLDGVHLRLATQMRIPLHNADHDRVIEVFARRHPERGPRLKAAWDNAQTLLKSSKPLGVKAMTSAIKEIHTCLSNSSTLT